MADLNLPILEAALAEGFFCAPLTENQRICLHWSIGRVDSLLNYIQDQGVDGASIEQISHHLKMHPNTAKIYCRWMQGAKLLDRTSGHGNQHQPAVYFVVLEEI
jgi:hypothetical protein